MRRGLALAVNLGLLVALASSAAAGSLDVRLGGFFPSENSNLFRDDRELYTVDKGDWNGFAGGVEYSTRVARNLELGIHVDGYERTLETAYRGFRSDSGREIRQTLKLEIVPVGLTLRIVPSSQRARIAPYIAFGADLFYWRYEEYGDFIDFDDPTLPFLEDSFFAEGVTGGAHVAGGVRVRVSHDLSLTGEGRYQAAPKVSMGDDFRGNTLDLNGWSATFGLHLRF